MRPAIPSLFGLLLIYPGLAAAIPLFPSFPHSSDFTSTRQHQSSWRRLSNSILSKIWPITEPHLATNDASVDLVAGTRGEKLIASYSQDVVLRFNVSTAEEAQSLAEATNTLFLDVWDFTQDWVDIRITKDVVPSLLSILPDSLQTKHVALMDNLDLTQAIFDTFPSSATSLHSTEHFTPSLLPSKSSDNIFFQSYQPYSVIVPWMNLLASMFPSHVRRINVGISYEGRDIPGLRVGVHPGNDDQPSEKRKTILITGGLHAREWISVSTVNYIAWNLITSYGKTTATTNLLEAFDWVFIPTLNPDGYVYSWETDRLWRKNRQQTSLRFCRGLDLDRSFSFHWDGESTQGNPCSESYAGSEPFQGVESRRFADWGKNETENNNVEFVTFLDLHSYSQQVLYPFSYTCQADPPTIEDLQELAFGLSKAIRLSQNGRFYHAIPACEGNVAIKDKVKNEKMYLPRIESGGGSALDYFYHELKVKFAYQIKLRDTGSYGFLLPKENIVPTGQEMLDAVLYLGRYLLGEVGLEVGSEIEDVEPTEMENNEALQNEHDFYNLDSEDDGALQNEQDFYNLDPEDDPGNWDWDDGDDSDTWELRRRRRK